METKSAFKSLTIWGVILASVCSFIHNRTGVNVADQVQPVQDAVTGIVNGLVAMAPALGQLAGAIMVLVGRFRATQPLHLVPPSSSPTGTVLPCIGIAAVILMVLGLTGCGTTSGGSSATATSGGVAPSTNTTASATSAAIESALPLIRTGAAVATGAVLDFAVQQPATRSRLANEMYSSANGVYTLTGGAMVTPAQFTSTVTSFGQSGDAQYAQYVTALSGLYAAYFPKLSTGDTKTATDLLNAIAGGIEDATASYVTAPVAAATTTTYWDGAEAARVAHNHEGAAHGSRDSSPSPGTFPMVARDATGAAIYSF